MLSNYELRKYNGNSKVWAGVYKNLVNRPHWHYDCELIHLSKGKGEVMINSVIFPLKEGDTLFVSTKEVHYIKTKDSLCDIIIFKDELVLEIIEKYHLNTALLQDDCSFDSLFIHIASQLAKKSFLFEIDIETAIKSYICEIFRKNPTSKVIHKKDDSEDQFKNLLVEIEQSYSTITFEKAAAFMSFTEPYFSYYFKKMSGETFSNYLNHIRVEKAIDMMKQNPSMSMTSISTYCGFDTIRTFNRVFLKLTNHTPKRLPLDFRFDHFVPVSGEERNPTDKHSILYS